MLYAEIIIPLALPKNYTWSVPSELAHAIVPGNRVEVNLGKNKKYAGIVKKVHNEKPEFFEPKDILSVLDNEPVIYEQQLKLWEWIASYYMCSEGEVMAAALPAHFKLSSETIVVFNEEYGDEFSALDHDEYLVAEALLLKKELRISEIQQVLDSSHIYPVVTSLIRKKVCHVWESLKQSYQPRREIFVLLHPTFANEETLAALLNEDRRLQRAEKQMELLLAYLHLSKTEGQVTKPALLKKSNASDAQLKGLVEKGILVLEKRSVDRITAMPRDVHLDFKLTPDQDEALQKLNEHFTQKQVCLLHGVTSSGKTLVYIKLIEKYIRQGKQVLYLLPEIALTSQIIRRLQKHFGGYAGIYHSKFNQNERIEIWNKVKSGEMQVVLGARSAIFLPFRDLGFVICDEEHDTSFKQHDPAPRYNARDAAIYLASISKANVLLGSATPSIESFHNAVSGKYGLATLTQRYGDMHMPQIEIIDTRKIIQKDRSKVMISPQLQEETQATISRGRQVILFQNRRGYSPYQICQACGWIPQCRYCDVSLTYHKFTNKLACHYCGTTYPPVVECSACGSHQFMQKNFGTEKIEEMLHEFFPDARIARMDIDTVRGKNAHDTLIQQLEQKRIDLLVGTQMVVKGLDFENVDLVGILDADALLSFADFRVNERAFQLMEQVSGRAGRKDSMGKVMIQAMNVIHPVLQFVRDHDYHAMYDAEIVKRKQFNYPPFTRIIQISLRHKFKEIANDAATKLANVLHTRYGNYISGPAEPVVSRVRNLFIMEMIYKLPRDGKLIAQCKHDILFEIANLHQEKRFRSVVVICDVDPV